LRQTGKDRRREQILVAAAEIAVREGLASLTMRTLSSSARVSVPTIYNLVGGRDEVIASVLELRASEFRDALARLQGEPIEIVVAISDEWVSYLVKHRDLIRSVICSGEVIRLRRSDAVTASAAAAVAEALECGRRTRDVAASTQPMLLAQRFAGMASAAILGWADGHGDDDVLRLELRHCALILLLACASDRRRSALARNLRCVERELYDQVTGP
jgi:AcrR family transcriptional regulator